MYPRQTLIQLVAHKAMLRREIARQRAECVAAAIEVARPVAWLDSAVAVMRELPPLARMGVASLGLWARRAALERLTRFAGVLRWVPLVSALWRKRR